MSLQKIKQLRSERISAITTLEQKAERLDNDTTLTNNYKREENARIKEEIQLVKNEYDTPINELIESGKKEAISNFNNAEYSGIKDEDAPIEVLKELRNQKQTSLLVKKHGGKSPANTRAELHAKANDLVSSNSPEAPAYIDAMKELGIVGIENLEQEYKDQNLNGLQKQYKDEITSYEQQGTEFNHEVNGDPFARILEKYNK